MTRYVFLWPALVTLSIAGCGGDPTDKQPKLQNPGDQKALKVSPAPAPVGPGAKGAPTPGQAK